jgi:hypothetical protein
LISIVIGLINVSRQDLRRKVGIISSEQVAFDEDSMAARTSSLVAGEKLVRDGGGVWGVGSLYGAEFVENVEDSLVILSLKWLRKAEGNEAEVVELGGKMGGVVRDSKESR